MILEWSYSGQGCTINMYKCPTSQVDILEISWTWTASLKSAAYQCKISSRNRLWGVFLTAQLGRVRLHDSRASIPNQKPVQWGEPWRASKKCRGPLWESKHLGSCFFEGTTKRKLKWHDVCKKHLFWFLTFSLISPSLGQH